jgi:hypothetical protein
LDGGREKGAANSPMANLRIEDGYPGAAVEIYKAIQMPLLERISGIEEQQKQARQEHLKALEDIVELLAQDRAIRDSIQKKFAETQAKTEAIIQMQLQEQNTTITKDLQARNEEYRTSLEQIISERLDKHDDSFRDRRAILEGYICEAKVASEAYKTSQRNSLEVIFKTLSSEQRKELKTSQKTLHKTMKDIRAANEATLKTHHKDFQNLYVHIRTLIENNRDRSNFHTVFRHIAAKRRNLMPMVGVQHTPKRRTFLAMIILINLLVAMAIRAAALLFRGVLKLTGGNGLGWLLRHSGELQSYTYSTLLWGALLG